MYAFAKGICTGQHGDDAIKDIFRVRKMNRQPHRISPNLQGTLPSGGFLLQKFREPCLSASFPSDDFTTDTVHTRNVPALPVL